MDLSLRFYLAAAHAIPLIGPRLLKRRLAKGKELPDRWREKLGHATMPRPEGPLIWLHAVGLGETLALRGLISALAARSKAHFLVTSTTRGSAEVFAHNLPERTCHQFLPLDAPGYLARFLDHWRPALSIWAEQDLWPGAVMATDARGIPLALVNARMNEKAFDRRQRWHGAYANLLARFRLVDAQDPATASHLHALGAGAVSVSGSLKAFAPPLSADPQALAELRKVLERLQPILLASSHPEDEAALLANLPPAPNRPLILIAPRDPKRGPEIAALVAEKGLIATRRGAGQGPDGDIWIVDSIGEMGLWYRLCRTTLIGGSFGPTEGHNPWEPAALGSAILHGPRVANFAADFAALQGAAGALQVQAQDLATVLTADHSAIAARAKALSDASQDTLGPLSDKLLALAGL